MGSFPAFCNLTRSYINKGDTVYIYIMDSYYLTHVPLKANYDGYGGITYDINSPTSKAFFNFANIKTSFNSLLRNEDTLSHQKYIILRRDVIDHILESYNYGIFHQFSYRESLDKLRDVQKIKNFKNSPLINSLEREDIIEFAIANFMCKVMGDTFFHSTFSKNQVASYIYDFIMGDTIPNLEFTEILSGYILSGILPSLYLSFNNFPNPHINYVGVPYESESIHRSLVERVFSFLDSKKGG